MVAGPGVPGERIRLRIRVLDGDGAPVDDAMVELRQADAEGAYAPPPARPEDPPPAFAGFGRLSTSKDGDCCFETIRPGAPAEAAGAAHVTVCLFMRGLLRHLYTRVYFEDDPALDRDPILSLVPAERRPTLLARRARPTARPGTSSCGSRATMKPSSSICEAAVTSRIVDALATTEALSAIFGDASTVQVLLDVEAALARAQAAPGRDPGVRRRGDHAAAVADGFDADALAREARASATIVIPLVAALTARVEAIDPVAARYVHWGATSQDIADTAMSLLIDRACAAHGRATHAALAASLRDLSDRHADTVMLGRTLLQPAPPITFGLKAAGGYAEPVPELGPRRAGAARGGAGPAGRRRRARWRRSAIAARTSPTRWRASSDCRRATMRRGTPRAIGWRRWSPPARSTPASSARSPATSAC